MCSLAVVVVLTLCAAGTAAEGAECAAGDCKQSDCAKKFGAAYQITVGGKKDPTVGGGLLSLEVRYTSKCSRGGSAFTAHVVPPKVDPSEDEAGGAELLERGMVLYAHRAEPECDSPSLLEAEWSGVVEMPLPELVRDEFEYIAFPPGSDFDMYVLSKTKSA